LESEFSILVRDQAAKFLKGLDPKQYKQVAVRIFLLQSDPKPNDCRPLEGAPGWLRIDQGEFRILYTVASATKCITIQRVGKRNDAEVYRGL